LVTLNAVFEAARVGNAGKLFSASVGEIEDMSEPAGNTPGKDLVAVGRVSVGAPHLKD